MTRMETSLIPMGIGINSSFIKQGGVEDKVIAPWKLDKSPFKCIYVSTGKKILMISTAYAIKFYY